MLKPSKQKSSLCSGSTVSRFLFSNTFMMHNNHLMVEIGDQFLAGRLFDLMKLEMILTFQKFVLEVHSTNRRYCPINSKFLLPNLQPLSSEMESIAGKGEPCKSSLKGSCQKVFSFHKLDGNDNRFSFSKC